MVHPAPEQGELARGVLEVLHRSEPGAATVGAGPLPGLATPRHRRQHRDLRGREPAGVGIGTEELADEPALTTADPDDEADEGEEERHLDE